MSTQLGYAKVYFTREDFGKMLKLKDIYNLTISNIENNGYGEMTLTIATPMDNITNNRVKISEHYNDTKRYRIPIKEDESVKEYSNKDELLSGEDYYLSIDLNRNEDNYAILFKESSDMQFKLIKFIKIQGFNLNTVADNLIEILKPYKNGHIIVPSVGIGYGLIDSLQSKNFRNIMSLDLDDLKKVALDNIKLVENVDLLYDLLSEDFSGKEQFMEFLELYTELKNIDMKMNANGNITFERKSKDIENNRIIAVFNALSKIGYKQ
jgi:hypothetical protein